MITLQTLAATAQRLAFLTAFVTTTLAAATSTCDFGPTTDKQLEANIGLKKILEAVGITWHQKVDQFKASNPKVDDLMTAAYYFCKEHEKGNIPEKDYKDISNGLHDLMLDQTGLLIKKEKTEATCSDLASMGAAHMRLDEWSEAVKVLTEALSPPCNANRFKVIYLRGFSYCMLGGNNDAEPQKTNKRLGLADFDRVDNIPEAKDSGQRTTSEALYKLGRCPPGS